MASQDWEVSASEQVEGTWARNNTRSSQRKGAGKGPDMGKASKAGDTASQRQPSSEWAAKGAPPLPLRHTQTAQGEPGVLSRREEAGCAWSASVQRRVAARRGQPPWAPGAGWVGKEQTAGCPCEGLPLLRAQKCAEGNCGCRVWKIGDLKLFFLPGKETRQEF